MTQSERIMRGGLLFLLAASVASSIGGLPFNTLPILLGAFADRLAAWLRHVAPTGDVEVWTSTLGRAIETCASLGTEARVTRALDEIDAGVCDGMTYEQIRRELPDEYAARTANKLRYRYPRGESYLDVVRRLDPIVLELERQRQPVLIVGHNAVIRALYAYFMNIPRERLPHVPIPLHTVLELVPTAYGCEERRHDIGPDTAHPDTGMSVAPPVVG